MPSQLTTPVSECVAVVVDPLHPYFDLAFKVTGHDGNGDIYCTFPYQGEELELTFKDGWMADDATPPQAVVLPRGASIVRELRDRLPNIEGTLVKLHRRSRRRISPFASRLAAKHEFISLLGYSPETQEAEFFWRYQELIRSWPSDGWDGAADAIAAHVRRINEVQTELQKIHRGLGRHLEKGEHYADVSLCVCGLPRDATP